MPKHRHVRPERRRIELGSRRRARSFRIWTVEANVGSRAETGLEAPPRGSPPRARRAGRPRPALPTSALGRPAAASRTRAGARDRAGRGPARRAVRLARHGTPARQRERGGSSDSPHVRGTTAILVTHDQDEALSLADSVAVLRDGRIAQLAPPAALYGEAARPRARVVRQKSREPDRGDDRRAGKVETPLGNSRPRSSGKAIRRGTMRPGDTVLVRPEQIGVRPSTLGAGAAGRVGQVVYHGHDSLLHLETTGAHGAVELVARRVGPDEPAVGDEVSLRLIGPVFC